MAKRLANMTWDELREELSIAGDRDKLTTAGKAMETTLSSAVDMTNPADITNAELILKRLQAEVQTWKRIYQQRTGQKI